MCVAMSASPREYVTCRQSWEVLTRPDDPRRPDHRSAGGGDQFEVETISISKLINPLDDGLTVDRGPQDPLSKDRCIGGTQTQGGKEHGRLVLADRMCRAEAILAELTKVDLCPIGVRQLHVIDRTLAHAEVQAV
jgi:hypothetical protein